jgi:hypothetical protein
MALHRLRQGRAAVTGWTAQAHLLADDIREPGFACAALNASAWSARTDPAASRGLVGAALALTNGDAGGLLWAGAAPCPDDKTLVEGAAELEGWAAELLKRASQMARECRVGLEAAGAALAGALAAQRAAAAQAAAAENGRQAAAAEAALAEAREAESAARAAIADCEAALEILDECGTRLAHAANCLAKVPGDLAAVYEQPYQHLADGGTLPHSGDFLGGIVTIGAA